MNSTWKFVCDRCVKDKGEAEVPCTLTFETDFIRCPTDCPYGKPSMVTNWRQVDDYYDTDYLQKVEA